MQMLVVDDSRAMRRMLTAYGESLGFQVTSAEDGVAALDVLQGGYRPGVALLDWDMPRMNGFELLRALRADASRQQMRIMMVTAQDSLDSVSRALDAGADDYLMKPVTEEAFADKLRLLGLL
jgi:two-component system, chemotaxis family, chemotaxis protein CheY